MSANGEFDALIERLERERPTPSAQFREETRRDLLRPTGPDRLRLRIAALAGTGGVLLLIVAAGAAGIGPLSAG